MALSGKLRLKRVTIIISCMVFIVPHNICRDDENRMFSNRFPNKIVFIVPFKYTKLPSISSNPDSRFCLGMVSE